MSKTFTIGFIGAGNMASALVGGLIAKGSKADQLLLCDINEEQLIKQKKEFGVETTTDNHQLISQCEVVVLSVKPQVMQAIVSELKEDIVRHQPLLISIAAGITIDNFNQWIGEDLALIRCMPNTPALLAKGASALFASSKVSDDQKANAEKILSAVGLVKWVDSENLIDAVTALSGSGPAYFFLMMEAMIEAGEALGLDKESATALTMQTALGAAVMAQNSDVDIAELRRRVTSPNGTTEAALNSFEKNAYRKTVKEAMSAAYHRSIELSGE